MIQWSESCGVTGLEIKPGDPVRVVMLDADYCSGDGPGTYYGLCSQPLAGVYDGHGNVQVDASTPEADTAFDFFCNMADLRRPSNNVLEATALPSDKRMWLMTKAAYDFLPELPLQEPDGDAATVGAAANAIVKQMEEAVMPHVAGVNSGSEGDYYDARAAMRSFEQDLPGAVSYVDEVREEQVASKVAMQGCLAGYRDYYVVYNAMQQARKMFVPSTGVGLASGGHKAVGELARFVRRKAIAAGFAGEG